MKNVAFQIQKVTSTVTCCWCLSVLKASKVEIACYNSYHTSSSQTLMKNLDDKQLLHRLPTPVWAESPMMLQRDSLIVNEGGRISTGARAADHDLARPKLLHTFISAQA